MKSLIVCLFAGAAISLVPATHAGPPDGGPAGRGGGPQNNGEKGPGGQGANGGGQGQGEAMLKQLMSLDANGDGALTPSEVTDPRAQQLLKQADTDGNGSVTMAELVAAMQNRSNQSGQQVGGQGGHGGPPRPGEILPGFVQQQLQLTDSQRQQIAALQAQVDAQLMQILTTQQLQQLSAGPPMGGGGGGQFGGSQFSGGGSGGPGPNGLGANGQGGKGQGQKGKSGKGQK